MTDTDQMVTWLRAAMDAAQHDAEAAAEEIGPDWYYEAGHVDSRRDDSMVATGSWDFLEQERGQHIARHDPAAVLRRITADRKLLAEHASDGDPQYPQCVRCADTHPGDCECGWHSLGGDHWRTAQTHPCATVRALAEGYGWTEEER